MALTLLGVLAPLVLVSSFSAWPLSQWIFVVASLLFPVALAALGATRGGRLGRWALAFLLFGGLLAAAGLAIVVFSAASSTASGWAGVPLALVLAFLGLWLLPFLLTSWLHAASFRDLGVNAEQIERLRRLARQDDGGGE